MPSLLPVKQTYACLAMLTMIASAGCAAPVKPADGPRSRLTTAGSAMMVENGVRLVPSQQNASGAAWFADKQPVSGGFEVSFAFQITQRDPTLGGGDGFAFVIQNAEANALNGPGGGLGYGGYPRNEKAGIRNSLAVEFDTLANTWDPNGNHISVQTRGASNNSADHSFSLGAATEIPNLEDGKLHTAKVAYRTPGTLSVYIDQVSKPLLVVNVDLDKTLRFDAGRAWVGFTAATATACESVQLLGWSFASAER